jgi:hypothetical protein
LGVTSVGFTLAGELHAAPVIITGVLQLAAGAVIFPTVRGFVYLSEPSAWVGIA